jgi:osmotically-inducible protein OsmY
MLCRPDEEIRADVLRELGQQKWFKTCKLNVAVDHGAVRFLGTLNDATIKAALRVAAEAVPGVVSVRTPMLS